MKLHYIVVCTVLLVGACGGTNESNADSASSPQSEIECEGVTAPSELTDYITSSRISFIDCLTVDSHGLVMAQIKVSGEEAIGTWEDLAALATGTGYWPVLLGDQQSTQRNFDGIEFALDEMGQTREQVLTDAANITYETWLEERTNSILGDIQGAFGGDFPSDGQTYSSAGQDFSFLTPRDFLAGGFHKSVTIAIVPAANSWDSASFLLWGCWNYNPCAAEHVAVLHEWNDRYGAEIVAITGDTIEMRVTRPPTEWGDALQLAREQYVYDNDIVDQGAGSIEVLASWLLDSPGWTFWWD